MSGDGEPEPSAESPLGYFFGNGARITLTNEGKDRVRGFYYHIDCEEYPSAVTLHVQRHSGGVQRSLCRHGTRPRPPAQ